MKILLTGGSGMVGSNFLEDGQAAEYEIIAPSSFELDLMDKSRIREVLSIEKPDLIIHAAGKVGGIHANLENLDVFMRENLQMGVNLVSEASELGVMNLINIASSCMYPRDAKNPLREDMLLSGELEPTNEGYALAKIVTAKLCEYVVRKAPQKNYNTVIPCNLYGRHDNFDPKTSHLVPAIIQKIQAAKSSGSSAVTIWGDGTARREFMSARDFSDFLFFAVKTIDRLPQYLNVGIGVDYSILEYYEAVADVIGFEGNFEFDLSMPTGMQRKLVDVNQLHQMGWHHQVSLAEGIAAAFKYYEDEVQNAI